MLQKYSILSTTKNSCFNGEPFFFNIGGTCADKKKKFFDNIYIFKISTNNTQHIVWVKQKDFYIFTLCVCVY